MDRASIILIVICCSVVLVGTILLFAFWLHKRSKIKSLIETLCTIHNIESERFITEAAERERKMEQKLEEEEENVELERAQEKQTWLTRKKKWECSLPQRLAKQAKKEEQRRLQEAEHQKYRDKLKALQESDNINDLTLNV